jgi:hypothetical protein
MQGYITFKDYLNSGFYVTQKKMLNQDIINTKKLFHILKQQKELQQQDLAITDKRPGIPKPEKPVDQ